MSLPDLIPLPTQWWTSFSATPSQLASPRSAPLSRQPQRHLEDGASSTPLGTTASHCPTTPPYKYTHTHSALTQPALKNMFLPDKNFKGVVTRWWRRTDPSPVRPYTGGLVCVVSHFSHVRLFVNLWTVTHQSPLSMGFSREEYWGGLPCPPPGNLPNPGIKPVSLTFLTLAGRFFTTSTTGGY